MKVHYLKEHHISLITTFLLDSGIWKWLCSSKEKAFTKMNSSDISDISHTWIGGANNEGALTFASAWDMVRSPEPAYQYADEIWCKCHSPKMAACLLRALNSKLLTKDFLKQLGIAGEKSCVLCQSSQESISHLFFQCHFSAYLWTVCKLKLGLSGTEKGTLQEEAEMILAKFSTKTKTTILAKLTLQATVWHVCRERNMRIFQSREQHNLCIQKTI